MTSKHSQTDYGLLTPSWPGTAAAEATSDAAFLQAMLDVEIGWSRTLIDAGLFDQADLAAIQSADDSADYDLEALALAGTAGGNALIPLVKELRAKVAALNPAATAAIHVGATSQDIIDSALMLMFKRSGEHTLDLIKEAVRALEKLAERHKDTPMVARSLTQHSLPATFGWRASHWLQALAQAGQALESQLQHAYLQWGGAAGTRAALADFLDRNSTNPALTPQSLSKKLAQQLGLTYAPIWQANRIPVLQAGFALAQILAACGKVANDVLISVRSENGELGEPVVEGRGGSSAMPHKQNPVLSVLIKNAAQASVGDVAALQNAVAANVEERADGGWHTEWQAFRNLMRGAGAAAEKTAELVSGLRVREDRMTENLARHGTLLATERLVSHLAPRVEEAGLCGTGEGKSYLQRFIAASLNQEQPLQQLLSQELPNSVVSAAELENLLDPSAYTGEAETIVETIIQTYSKWSHS